MQIFVRPIEGRKVRNPDTGFGHLPANGDFVVRSPYWLRKIREGAVKTVDTSSEDKSTQSAKAATASKQTTKA